MDYCSFEVNELRHRYAIWAAHRAAFRGQKGADAANVRSWFQAIGFSSQMKLPDLTGNLPKAQRSFDKSHRKWREGMIKSSKALDDVSLTHGQAAKAINIYLKTRFVLSEPDSDAARVIHPPIDRILLINIGKAIEQLRSLVRKPGSREPISWRALDSEEYEALIDGLRKHVGAEPFWKLEFFWDVGV